MLRSKKSIIDKQKVNITAQQVIVGPSSIAKVGRSQIRSFLDFIRSSSVLGLSVGIVLGGAVGVLVRSLIENVVMPPLGLLFGSTDGIKGLVWEMGKTRNGDMAVLSYGVFLNDLINFAVIALVVYVIVSFLVVSKPGDKKK